MIQTPKHMSGIVTPTFFLIVVLSIKSFSGVHCFIQNKNSFIVLRTPKQHCFNNDGTHLFLSKTSNDTDDDAPTKSTIMNRLDLSSRFSRWKVLQDILEEEEIPTAQDINEILFLILKSFLENPRPIKLPSGDTNPSPTLTAEQRELLVNELFHYQQDKNNEEETIGLINAIPTDESGNDSMMYDGEETIAVYNFLEKLHPDRQEDEDAFKGCWDLIMELYGKEATKISEQSGDKSWKMRSSVVRLLIHYDFLVEGIDETMI